MVILGLISPKSIINFASSSIGQDTVQALNWDLLINEF